MARKKGKASGKKKARVASQKRRRAPASGNLSPATEGPLTIDEARTLIQRTVPRRAPRRALLTGKPLGAPDKVKVTTGLTLGTVAANRKRLRLQQRQENLQRIREYKSLMTLLRNRGVAEARATKKPTKPKPKPKTMTRRRAPALNVLAGEPLRILAEGDSWFDYPAPFFGGSIIPRLEQRIGVPILCLAKAGDEIRYMLGVEERKILTEQLKNGSPAGGPWDVLLFSGGGNDVVDNPMALWVKDFDLAIPLPDHIHQARFQSVLALVRAGYEDLITLRDALSPTTHLVFHGYDFPIPDGRGICHLGPWLKPTFDLRNFPSREAAFAVTKSMLEQFAAMLASLATDRVTFINGQGTLKPETASWHNELHPSKAGFDRFAEIFKVKLKELFPTRVF